MINIHESTKFINELLVIRNHKVKTENKSVFIKYDFTSIQYELKITLKNAHSNLTHSKKDEKLLQSIQRNFIEFELHIFKE